MNSFDRGRTYAVPVLPPSDAGSHLSSQTRTSNANVHNTETIESFRHFLTTFRDGESFVYRDRLRTNLLRREYTLEVNIDDLIGWDEELAARVRTEPGEMIPLFEIALWNMGKQILLPALAALPPEERQQRYERELPPLQLQLRSGSRLMQFRDLGATSISQLVRLPGIVVSASVLAARASRMHLMCRNCRHVKIMHVSGGFSGFVIPRRCEGLTPDGASNNCPLDSYAVVHDRSQFVDQQVIKLQEAPDRVPVGELPRHVLLSADRYLTGRVIPGKRIVATGVYGTCQVGGRAGRGAPALRTPYLRVVGLEVEGAGSGTRSSFTAEEEEQFLQMARSEGFYARFASSIAPSIFGNVDVKKAVLCLLLGGSRKQLPDGMRLRGDINVLMLGDPGTAKSQLLKFVEKAAPIAVYTSGKGSSAAGLTASVQRDPQSGEFYLEGGAMVLADGGVVCIDEFDKMRDDDRVAIHEAMEQQTISIAKAGITTVLNSRTSVLAAANPVFGRYDDMKSPGENIDFQTTILSRFDMIFIIKDDHDESQDRAIAKHVMNLHMNRATDNQVVGEIEIDRMRRFISFCKARCAPRLSPAAAEKLSNHFVQLRKEVQQVERDNNERSSIPITVRQLEAIVRISESLAKLTLAPTVQTHHVDEAIRLFKFSTMNAIQAGHVEGLSKSNLMEEIHKVEADIKRRLPIGWNTSYASLVREFVQNQGYSQHALDKTLYILERRDVIRFAAGKKSVHRIGV